MAIRKNQKSKLKNQNLGFKTQDLSTSSVGGSPILSKLRQPIFFIPLIIVVLAVLAFVFKGLFVVAIVNGQPITRLAVIQELEKRNGKQALTSMITQTLILQEAKKKNINVGADEVSSMIKKLEDDLKKQGQDLNQALSFQGMTKKDLEEQFRIKILVEKMLEKDIKVTDKEISDFIEKNKESIPESMKTEEATSSAREQLKQQKLSEKVQKWLSDLQAKAKIQHFVNY